MLLVDFQSFRVHLRELFRKFCSELAEDFKLSFDVLVALQCSVKALFRVKRWILALVDVVKYFNWNVLVDLIFCLVDVLETC